jgi:hypothetical protein
LAPQQLTSGRNVFEELGTGFTLLAFDADESAVKSFEAAAQALRLPLRVVRDSYQDGRSAYESCLVLVRPDQHVVWAGNSPPPESSGLLRRVAGLA